MTVILFDHKFDVVVFVSGIIPNALLVKYLEECLSDLLVMDEWARKETERWTA